ncbi:MAG: hypothetical protein AAF846_14070 [Chloroflexota bacterium]
MNNLIEPKKRVPIKLKNKLSFAFGFDFGDIQDNRSGFISHWQKKRLRWSLLNYSVSIGIWAVILSFVSLFLLDIIFVSLFQLGVGDLMTITIYFTGLFGVLSMFWIWKSYAIWSDMRQGRVHNLVSEVRRITNYRPKTYRSDFLYNEHDYFVEIANQRYSVTREQMQAFQKNRLYNIYIAPKSRQILSAELLDDKVSDNAFDFLKDEATFTIQDIIELENSSSIKGEQSS